MFFRCLIKIDDLIICHRHLLCLSYLALSVAMLLYSSHHNTLIALCLLHYLYTLFYQSFLNRDRKSTRLNSSHVRISYAVFCLKKKISVTETRLVESTHLSTFIPTLD